MSCDKDESVCNVLLSEAVAGLPESLSLDVSKSMVETENLARILGKCWKHTRGDKKKGCLHYIVFLSLIFLLVWYACQVIRKGPGNFRA